VEFRDTGRGPEPILDVEAQTQVLDFPTKELAQDIVVQIHVTGPLTDLQIAFTSEPERAPDEIVALLSIGRLKNPEAGSVRDVSDLADPSRRYLMTEVVAQI